MIVFEGPEGSGKSTQTARTAAWLRGEGHGVCVTREPGGTTLGCAIRALVMDSHSVTPGPLAELFLYLADRAEHVSRVIQPVLSAGEIVLSDRFSASTIAYQSYARGLEREAVERADTLARQGIVPDLNILLDCPVEIGLARAHGSDRFHAEENEFHERVRRGFHAIAAADPPRWLVVDATGDPDAIQQRIAGEILRRELA